MPNQISSKLSDYLYNYRKNYILKNFDSKNYKMNIHTLKLSEIAFFDRFLPTNCNKTGGSLVSNQYDIDIRSSGSSLSSELNENR